MQQANIGLCETCHKRVPAEHRIRGGKVFLRKHCPDCGESESLVSSDAQVWQAKHDIWHYRPKERVTCTLHCDHCGLNHQPTIVFLDVTNRCNMNCPICIANIRGMGFEYNPPLEYFEKIFAAIGRFDPTPMVELFGGEPTMRDDLIDIINIGRANGLKPRVVTNGLRLADEEFCRKLCESRTRVRFAFDGRDPEIYRRLRGNPHAYEKKMKALENLKKYSRRKHAIICCAAKGFNDDKLPDLIQFCHDNMDTINELGFIPLTENWEPGEFEEVERTTMEDVEHMIEQSVPGGEVEFVPAGLVHGLRKARSFFREKSRSEVLMLGGVHPNCESMTILMSDGRCYRSANHFLKMPISKIATEILERNRRIDPALSALNPKNRFDRLWGRYIVLKTFLPLFLRAVDYKNLCKGSPIKAALRILGGLIRGRRSRDLLHQHLNTPKVLRIAMLPFEEYHSIDGARLENCKAVFAYEDVDDGRVKTIPACTWYMYRNEILKKIGGHYAARHEKSRLGGNSERHPACECEHALPFAR